MTGVPGTVLDRPVAIPAGGERLDGNLTLPRDARGLVLFAHGSGSSRLSPRNQQVAQALHETAIGTLLFDLLTAREARDRRNVFDIALLADRLRAAAGWARSDPDAGDTPQGYFGASTGAAAAIAAAAGDSSIRAIVSRGGRPDLAGTALTIVNTPVLLIVGGDDREVLQLNEEALERMTCVKSLVVVPGATHLFEEPGTLELVAKHAAGWFVKYLAL